MRRIVYFVGIVAFFLFSTGKIFAQVPTQAFSVCSTDSIKKCNTDQAKVYYFNKVLPYIQVMPSDSSNNCPIKDYGKLQEGQVNDFYTQCWRPPYDGGVDVRGYYFSYVYDGCGCFLDDKTEPLYQNDFTSKLESYLVTSNPGTPPPNTPTPGKGYIPTPTPGYLDSYKLNVDQTVAGSIGGPCLAGNVELSIDSINDFSTDLKEENKSGVLKSILNSAKDNLNKLTQSALHYWNTIRGSVVTTDFCPVDKDKAIPVFSTNAGYIVFTADQINAASGKADEELDALEANGGTFTSDHRRVFAAFRLLKSTADMDVDERAQAFKTIQEILSGSGNASAGSKPPISCECKDKVQYAQELKTLSTSSKILDKTIANESGNNGGTSVLGIMVGGHDYDFSSIDNTLGLNLRGNDTLKKDYCRDLSIDERIKKYNSDAADTCVKKLGDTYLSAKQSCGALLSIKDHEEEHLKCLQCSWLDSGAWTAVGCIYSDFSKTVERLFTLALGFGGLAALGCIIYASFIMQTSAGNPEKTKKAQDLITSCIAGLILIIFSVFILRVIGVDILRIPGFG